MAHRLSLSRAFAAVLSLAAASARAAGPTPDELTDDQVVAALNKGVDWIFAQQQNGVWETNVFDENNKRYDGGDTALVLYTLLHVGESLKDPRLNSRAKELKTAIELVKKIETDLVYLRAMQCMALAQIRGDKDVDKTLRAASKSLLAGMNPQGGYLYKFTDAKNISATNWDNSATQLSILAAWGLGASDAKIEVNFAYWQAMDKYWRARQNTDGGWGYATGNDDWKKSSLSMSPAGVASLFILGEQSNIPISLIAKPDKNVANGLDWLDKNLNPANAFDGGWPSGYFTLFAVERVALAAGRKYIGGKDWYRTGAVALLNRQDPDGHFPAHYYYHDTKSDVVPTCFALLFLARGRNPMAFNKLEYNLPAVPGAGPAPVYWNARPYDAAHLTQWMGPQLERAINWQSVSFATDPESWLDAPCLLITGSQDPKFSDDDLAKLRAYVEAGGLIFSSADGNSQFFTKAMNAYAAKIFKGAEMRELPLDHPVYSTWGKAHPTVTFTGVTNGVRELWIHSGTDLGASWQRRAYAGDYFDLGAKVYFYASGGAEALTPRLRSLKVVGANVPATRTWHLARLKFDGNWDPEPGAFRRLVKIMRATDKLDLQVEPVAIADLDFAKTPIAHLTACDPIKLPPESIAKLKAFIDAGGTLLIDPAGGADKTVDALSAIAVQLSATPPDILPSDAPVLTGDFPTGEKIDALKPRRWVAGHPAHDTKFRVIRKGDRNAVILAPMDIISGLLGTQTQGIFGYAPESATVLMRNLILATVPVPPPATQTQPASGTQPATALQPTSPPTQPAP